MYMVYVSLGASICHMVLYMYMCVHKCYVCFCNVLAKSVCVRTLYATGISCINMCACTQTFV